MSTIDLGLTPDEALRRAPEFLRGLREGKISPAEDQFDDASIDVLHAACHLLAEPNAGAVEEPLDSVRALYDFIEKVTWLGPDFDERAELLGACAFAGWRIARRKTTPSEIEQWQSRLVSLRSAFPYSGKAHEELTIPKAKGVEPHLDDPETLLPLLDSLRQRVTGTPETVIEQTAALYAVLHVQKPHYPADLFLLDEREYFLGETARIAGSVARILSRRDEARNWFDLAEGWVLLTENASGSLSKLSYQRLALRVEERDFEGVLALLPQLILSFEKLGMAEDCLRARSLYAIVLKETDDLPRAKAELEAIAQEARTLRKNDVLGSACVNLVQLHAALGESAEAMARVEEVAPLLRQAGNRSDLAKLHLGIGFLLRGQGQYADSIVAYRAAQSEFGEIGMKADVGAMHLIIADLLLDENQEKQAEREIRQALPLIDEYKLVPEGVAAMTLLRESLRRQKIDRQALRNLHGYFEERKS